MDRIYNKNYNEYYEYLLELMEAIDYPGPITCRLIVMVPDRSINHYVIDRKKNYLFQILPEKRIIKGNMIAILFS